MNDLYVQFGFERPAAAVAVGVIGRFIDRRNDLDRYWWQAKLLIEHIHILLQGRTAKGNNIDHRLSLPGITALDERFHSISNAQGLRSLASWRAKNGRGACLGNRVIGSLRGTPGFHRLP